MEPKSYPASVFWSDEDSCYVAIAPDLPGTSGFGDTEQAALDELRTVILLAIEALEAAGNPIPKPSKPSSLDDYSGKLLLRIPKSLHQRLAVEAKSDNVSLNQYIVYRLSSSAVEQIKIFSMGPEINRVPMAKFHQTYTSSEKYIQTDTRH